MSELVNDCPRCGANSITFDVTAGNLFAKQNGWRRSYEAFAICRACKRSTIFTLIQNNANDDTKLKSSSLANLDVVLNKVYTVTGFISLKDASTEEPPEHLPPEILAAFQEGAICMSTGCFNAGATMFRLCLDLSTRGMLPTADEKGLNNKIRRNLGLRLPWMFDNGVLPEALRELSTCIKDDGNDGAHEGTLCLADAEDLYDFAYVLLERIYTEPKRIELAKARRTERR